MRSRTCRKTQVLPSVPGIATRTLPRRTQMVTSSRVLTRDGCRLVQGYMGPVFQVALTGSAPAAPRALDFRLRWGVPETAADICMAQLKIERLWLFFGAHRGGLRAAATTRAGDDWGSASLCCRGTHWQAEWSRRGVAPLVWEWSLICMPPNPQPEMQEASSASCGDLPNWSSGLSR